MKSFGDGLVLIFFRLFLKGRGGIRRGEERGPYFQNYRIPRECDMYSYRPWRCMIALNLKWQTVNCHESHISPLSCHHLGWAWKMREISSYYLNYWFISSTISGSFMVNTGNEAQWHWGVKQGGSKKGKGFGLWNAVFPIRRESRTVGR